MQHFSCIRRYMQHMLFERSDRFMSTISLMPWLACPWLLLRFRHRTCNRLHSHGMDSSIPLLNVRGLRIVKA
jgi:hypothetical protein